MTRLTILAAAIAVGVASTTAHAESDHPRVDKETWEALFEAKEKQAKADGNAASEDAIDPVTTASIPRDSAAEKKPARRTTLLQRDTPAGEKAQEKAAAVAKNVSSTPFSALISQYAQAYGVPVPLAKAVVRIESNFRPQVTGRAGEVGLMQIKPATARSMGFSGSVKQLYNPETNIKYGMKYLAEAHRLGGGQTCQTILRYNAGHGARRMNPVSAAYCQKVKRAIGTS